MFRPQLLTIFRKICLACAVYVLTYMQGILHIIGGRESSVGIATRYGLDGPVIESRWGGEISAPVQTGPRAHPVSYTMGTRSFPGVKRPGSYADPPLHLKLGRAIPLPALRALVACYRENLRIINITIL